jgi:16S rRNA (guanine(966)-N(2))-methyltransferase RsmD
MTLKILGGKFKGRTINTSSSDLLRPTKGVLRQAVFNICQNEIVDAYFLDLFAGSGAMGFEALSRGAKKVTFVEKDKASVAAIHQTADSLQVQSQISILALDMLEALKRLKGSYHVVYIDPPYSIEEKFIYEIMQSLTNRNVLQDQALVFIEMPFDKNRLEDAYVFSHFSLINSRKNGKSLLHQYLFTNNLTSK